MANIKFNAPPTISDFMRSQARRRYIMGPFGSGKSSGCSVEILRRAGERPHWTDGFRHSRAIVVRNTTPQLRDTTLKTWFQWFPNGSIGVWKATEKTYYIQTGDIRCEVMFRALDDPDDVKNLLSLEINFAWMNECREIEPDIAAGIDGRLGRWRHIPGAWNGMWGDTNPPIEDSYWYHISEGNDPETGLPVQNNGWEAFHQPSGLAPNAENLEHLPEGRKYYTEMMSGKTENYINMYVHGTYGRSIAGKSVHSGFIPDIHVSKQPLIVDRTRPILLGFDFGLTPACVIKQQDVRGRVLTLREFVTPEDVTMGLRTFLREHVKPVLNNEYRDLEIGITGDPSGSQRGQADEVTCDDILRQEGFERRCIEFAPNNLAQPRRDGTDYFLSQLIDGKPAYLVDPSCRYLKRGLSGGYHFERLKTKNAFSAQPTKNIYSHITEASEYADMKFKSGVGAAAKRKSHKNWLAQVPSNPGYHSGR